MKDPATLDEAYSLYKDNKFQRKDMVRLLIDAVKVLQTRIGGVDEAAVNELRKRVEAMETTIGNALIGAKSDEMHRQLQAVPMPKSLTSQLAELQEPDPDKLASVGSDVLPRKPGRPRKEAA